MFSFKMFVRKCCVFTACLYLYSVSVSFAQSPFETYAQFNDAGIYAAIMNPANTCYTPDRLSINVLGIGVRAQNNVFKTRLDHSLARFGVSQFSRDNKLELSEPLYTISYNKEQAAALLLNTDILLPSLKVNISRKFSAFAYFRERVVGNVFNTSASVMGLLSENNNEEDVINLIQSMKGDILAYAFHESAFGISGIIYNKREKFIKAGVTLKLNSGLGLYALHIDDFDARLQNDQFTLTAGYQRTKVLEEYYRNADISILGNNALGRGIGADIGFTYEYRPNYLRRTYQKYNRKGKNPFFISPRIVRYKYKLSASVLDIGNIDFNHSSLRKESFAINYTASVANPDTLKLFQFQKDIIDSKTFMKSTSQQIVGLPTTACFTLDYNLMHNWYLNAIYKQNLRDKAKGDNAYNPSSVGISLRKEGDVFSCAVPVRYTPALDIINVGLLAKAGPVFLGTENLQSLFGKKMYDFSLMFGIVLNFKYKHDPSIHDFVPFKSKKR